MMFQFLRGFGEVLQVMIFQTNKHMLVKVKTQTHISTLYDTDAN